MATIKSYTDLEQSKKLTEILPLESADTCWTNHMFGSLLSSLRIESTPPQEYKSLLDRFVVRGYLIEPAWSLTALLSTFLVINSCTPSLKITITHKYYMEFCIDYFEKKYIQTSYYESPIDACCEMILKLNKKHYEKHYEKNIYNTSSAF